MFSENEEPEPTSTPLRPLSGFKFAALQPLLCALVATAALAQQPSAPTPVVPIDPITGILEAFKTNNVVALGEGNHGNEQGAAFRLSLIRDPRFAATVNDIVVESGNSLYQDMMDRFVRGQDVPDKELRQVWQNTTQVFAVWDRPIYEDLFRTVRAVNASLPKDRQLRVLLGDPPIDWAKINSAEDYRKFGEERDSYPAGLIQREVLAKRHRALVIYGDLHFLRKNLYWPFSSPGEAERRFHAPVNTIVSLLETSGATKVFSIWTYTYTGADLRTLQPGTDSWRTPSLVIIHGTSLGVAPFTFYYPFEMYFLINGITEQHRADPVRSSLMQDQFDAVLYLGPLSSITPSRLSPALCSDPEYVQMRSERFALTSPPGGLGNPLKAECDQVIAP